MNKQSTDLELEDWLVEVAVAAAPAFTEEQIIELRRVLKPCRGASPASRSQIVPAIDRESAA